MNTEKTSIALAVAAALMTSPIAMASSTLAEAQLGNVTAGIALDPVARRAIISNYNDGTVSIVDVDDPQAPPATVSVGANPRRLVHNAATHMTYVVNDTTPGTVTVLDVTSGAIVATIGVGNRPRNIQADFAHGKAFVSNLDSNSVSVIDTNTNEVTATVGVGSSPFIGGIDPLRGRVYAVSQLDRVVHVIDRDSMQVLFAFNTGRFPSDATVDQRTGKVYVNNEGDGTLSVYDPQAGTLKLVTGVGSGTTANFGTVSAVYKRYYLPRANDYTVTVIDTDTDEIVKSVPVGASPQQVVVDGSDGDAYVVNRLGNSVSVIDARFNTVIDSFKVGVNPWRITQGMDRVFTLNENGNRLDSMSVANQADTLGDTAVATEYHHAVFDHYFHSVGEAENRLIADGLFRDDWARTMSFFRVWTQDGPNRVGVCRFFTTAFGEKSSHFYTPAGAECDALKAGSVWQYEEMSYFVELPDAAGACREGTVPLYRAYNNGMGGAPNHRLTTDKAARDALVDSGWVAEGVGEDAVVACLPPLTGEQL